LIGFSELPNACERLDACERMFKASYGTNLERLQVIVSELDLKLREINA